MLLCLQWKRVCTPYLSLRLSNVHVDELRAFDAQEVDAAFCRHCLGHQSLARACSRPQLVVLYWQALLHTPHSHVLAVHGSQACQNVRQKCQQTAQHATSRSIAKSKCRSHKGSYSPTVDLCCMSSPNFTAHRILCKHHLVPICRILLHDNS